MAYNMNMGLIEASAKTILDEFIRGGLKVVYHHWYGSHGEDVDYDWDLIWDPDGRLTETSLNERSWKFVSPEPNLKKYRFEEEGVTNIHLLSDREREFVMKLLDFITYSWEDDGKTYRSSVHYLNVAASEDIIPSGPDLTHPAADECYETEDEELVDLVISGKALVRDDIIARAAGLDPEQRKNVLNELYHVSVPKTTPVMHIFFNSVSGKMQKERIYLNDIELVEDSYDQDVYLDNVVLGEYDDEDIEIMVASLSKDGEA